jgi:Kef-type K+ transport system membrane component KefB
MDHGLSAITWAALALMLLAAKLGGEAASRLRQPPVLGELMAGVVLGNLPIPALIAGANGPAISFAAELGVMLLLFQVGLESSVGDMIKVAPRAGFVALLGVVFPSVLGMAASRIVLPSASSSAHLFVGATLCATSVGITASVLKDLGALGSAEARVVLGAAVIDDILGLIVLSVVTAIATTGAVAAPEIARISLVAIVFVVGALVLGLGVTRGVYRVASVFRGPHVLGAVSVALCLLLGGASELAGLAPIVGAYAAGLLLDEVSVRPFGSGGVKKVEDFVSPIVAVFAPIFFVRTGMSVHLSGLGADSILLTVLLVVAAIVGKLVCGLGVRGKDVDRLTVGIGMTPRGEVGLIFAGAAAHLEHDGKPLLSSGTHAALVATVFITTLLAPPALAWRIRARSARPHEQAGPTAST